MEKSIYTHSIELARKGIIMNKGRLQEISGCIKQLEDILEKVEAISEAEEDTLSNYPENLEGSEQYERRKL